VIVSKITCLKIHSLSRIYIMSYTAKRCEHLATLQLTDEGDVEICPCFFNWNFFYHMQRRKLWFGKAFKPSADFTSAKWHLNAISHSNNDVFYEIFHLYANLDQLTISALHLDHFHFNTWRQKSTKLCLYCTTLGSYFATLKQIN
jgi:hypothetical protein